MVDEAIGDAGGPGAQPVDLLVSGGTIFTLDAADRVIAGDVAVRDGRIVAIGPNLEMPAKRVLEASNAAVLPGFVNSHMHECMERGWFEDLPFMEWLTAWALPKDRAYEPRHMHASALLNQLEMIQNGTTSFVDIFRFPAEAAAVALRSGLRATFSPQIIDEPEGVGESLEDNIAFVDEWRGRSPLIRTWFGPHSLYTCREETYRRVRVLADHYGVGVHTHLAESHAEVDIIAARTGVSPTRHLHDLIGLAEDVAAAHCVYLDEDDVALLAATGTGVAHCPTSNMKMGNGVARILDLLAAGVSVGLGTDSNMTNNNLDMFEEMRLAALLQKVTTEDASVLPCRDVLRMATTGSAAVLGLRDEVGSLELGKSADLIVVDLSASHVLPVFSEGGGNVIEQLVYSCSGSDVRSTVVAGQVLMEDRAVLTLDADEVYETVQREARDLMEKAGVTDMVLHRRVEL